jgi:nitronate monooxygenase
MNWKNSLTENLHLTYPFIQAPMLNVTTPAMAAAISNRGALGSLPVGGWAPGKALHVIQQTKSLTGKPFAVNIFANDLPSSVNEDTWQDMQDIIERFAQRYNLSYEKQTPPLLQFISYEEQLEILIQEKIPVVSFTFGILSDDAINILHRNNVLLAGTATSVEEARLLADKDIDIIVVQGMEAGGHRGSFLHKTLPQEGLMALLPQIVEVINKPVVAAGSIADGRSIKAAMALGAQGVQVGSAFIACTESAANATYKQAVQQAEDGSTTLTKAYTGRWLRCIKTDFIETLELSGLPFNDYPIQQLLTGFLRTLHNDKNAIKFLPMLAGQRVRKSKGLGAAEILMQMINECDH